MVEIQNLEELEQWLKYKDQDLATVLALRTSLRKFEMVFQDLNSHSQAGTHGRTTLLTARAILSAICVVARPSPDVRKAAKSSYFTVFVKNRGISSAAKAASSVALSTSSKSISAKESIRSTALSILVSLPNSKLNLATFWDVGLLNSANIKSLFLIPLWHGPKLRAFGQNYFEKFKKDHLSDRSEFQFWVDWYQGYLDGKPMDWDFQERIALIPDEDWEKGAVHIAKLIKDIQTEFLLERAPLAETIEFDKTLNAFFAKYDTPRKPNLLATSLNIVSDALDDALNGRNGLNENSFETKVIRRTIEKYAENPEYIEMKFETVYTGMARQMDSGELPESEENLALQTALRDGALDIRANHPEIAENRQVRARQALAEVTPEQMQPLGEASEMLQDITVGEVHADFIEDIPYLIDHAQDTHKTPAYFDAANRTAHRVAAIQKESKKTDVLTAIETNTGYRSLRVMVTLGSLISLFLLIFGAFIG